MPKVFLALVKASTRSLAGLTAGSLIQLLLENKDPMVALPIGVVAFLACLSSFWFEMHLENKVELKGHDADTLHRLLDRMERSESPLLLRRPAAQ